jgi:small-conductance mechanosensitive channel
MSVAALAQSAGPWTEALDKLRGLATGVVASLPNLVVAVVVLAAFVLAGHATRAAMRRLVRRRGEHWRVALVLGRVTQGAAVLLGLLVGAVIVFPNFTPTSLIQFLGIGSVAFGFAFRDVLQNYLAGILLLLTQPFRIHDQIKFQDYEGTVEDIQTRATFIRTYDGRRVVIPNAELFTHTVVVHTAFPTRRIEYDVGIGYGDDIDRAKALILEVLEELHEAVDDPPPDVLTHELAPSSVVLRVRWWIRPPARQDALDARDHVIAAIKKKLLESGIDLPFPTQHVLVHDQTEATDGDRRRQREGWPAGKGDVPAPRPLGSALAVEDGDREPARSRRDTRP